MTFKKWLFALRSQERKRQEDELERVYAGKFMTFTDVAALQNHIPALWGEHTIFSNNCFQNLDGAEKSRMRIILSGLTETVETLQTVIDCSELVMGPCNVVLGKLLKKRGWKELKEDTERNERELDIQVDGESWIKFKSKPAEIRFLKWSQVFLNTLRTLKFIHGHGSLEEKRQAQNVLWEDTGRLGLRIRVRSRALFPRRVSPSSKKIRREILQDSYLLSWPEVYSPIGNAGPMTGSRSLGFIYRSLFDRGLEPFLPQIIGHAARRSRGTEITNAPLGSLTVSLDEDLPMAGRGSGARVQPEILALARISTSRENIQALTAGIRSTLEARAGIQGSAEDTTPDGHGGPQGIPSLTAGNQPPNNGVNDSIDTIVKKLEDCFHYVQRQCEEVSISARDNEIKYLTGQLQDREKELGLQTQEIAKLEKEIHWLRDIIDKSHQQGNPWETLPDLVRQLLGARPLCHRVDENMAVERDMETDTNKVVLHSLNTEVSRLSRRLEDIEKERDIAAGRVRTLEREAAALTVALKDLKTEAGNLRTSLTAKSQTISILESEAVNLKGELTVTRSRLTHAETLVNDLYRGTIYPPLEETAHSAGEVGVHKVVLSLFKAADGDRQGICVRRVRREVKDRMVRD